MMKVVLPTYTRHCPGCTTAYAAQNSASRLVGGSMMHYMSALTRNQALSTRKPSQQAVDNVRLRRLWVHIEASLGDEAGAMNPHLLASQNARACYGREHIYKLVMALLPATCSQEFCCPSCLAISCS